MIGFRKFVVFPGQFIITSVPALITTVLGSCISVCLWDRKKMIGGLNHYLLPGNPQDQSGDPDRGYPSTRMLVRSLLNRNADLQFLEAKVFGGCNSLYREKNTYRIGERNTEAALQVLKEFNIPVVAQHVGGSYGRKIVFNTATGKVRMRLLGKSGTEINEEIDKGFGY